MPQTRATARVSSCSTGLPLGIALTAGEVLVSIQRRLHGTYHIAHFASTFLTSHLENASIEVILCVTAMLRFLHPKNFTFSSPISPPSAASCELRPAACRF